ncbi:hypothetical protein F2P79_002522 [Pimephales promelas]|nr:hypothetical protein F2P79_002522 [Pimephales promelas]
MALASDLIECTVGTENMDRWGSHELEEPTRPRGHSAHLFPAASPSRMAAAFGNKDQSSSHRTPSAGHPRPLLLIQSKNNPFTRPSARNTSKTPPRPGLLGKTFLLLLSSSWREFPIEDAPRSSLDSHVQGQLLKDFAQSFPFCSRSGSDSTRSLDTADGQNEFDFESCSSPTA